MFLVYLVSFAIWFKETSFLIEMVGSCETNLEIYVFGTISWKGDVAWQKFQQLQLKCGTNELSDEALKL